MTAKNARKRAAPSASPDMIHSTNYVNQQDPYLQWTSAKDDPSYTDQGTYGTNLYSTLANQSISTEPSNQLARRQEHSMVPRATYTNGNGENWPGMMDTARQNDFTWIQTSDEEKLDEEAQKVMEQAKKSRKSIPPFVQKLRR
jgi:hypothetical protein